MDTDEDGLTWIIEASTLSKADNYIVHPECHLNIVADPGAQHTRNMWCLYGVWRGTGGVEFWALAIMAIFANILKNVNIYLTVIMGDTNSVLSCKEVVLKIYKRRRLEEPTLTGLEVHLEHNQVSHKMYICEQWQTTQKRSWKLCTCAGVTSWTNLGILDL